MILHDSPLAHVHCPKCGREMRPGTSCMVCTSGARLVSMGLTGSVGPGGIVEEITGTPVGDAVSAPVPTQASTAVAARAPVAEPAPAPSVVAAPPRTTARPAARRKFRPIDLWKRYLPPVRLVWIFLLVLVDLQGGFANLTAAAPILSIVFLGVVTDLGFQRVRFPKLRVPDAALATSLFVGVIVWPTTVGLALASIAVISVGLRHVFRVQGHPLLNPAAAGITLATVVFGLSTSWHVGTTLADSVIVALMGAVLVARAPHTYRLPIGYFALFLPLTAVLTVALGGARNLVSLMEQGALGPASIFFGVFMVTEPRTAPSARRWMWGFAALVGAFSAVLPAVFSEVTALGAVGVLAPFLALFVGNIITVAIPAARGVQRPTPTAARPVPAARPSAE